MFYMKSKQKKVNVIPECDVMQFLSLFPGMITVQTFDDRATKRPTLSRIIHFAGVITEKIAYDLMLMNTNRAGIYFSVNETDGKGRAATNVIRVRSVFADLDGSPIGPALVYSPTVIVESSTGKFHCYWFTEDVPLEAFGPMQKNIARILSGDPKVHDLPRVLRIPGYYHNKGERFMVHVVEGSGKVYTYRDLVEMFPPLPAEKWSGKRYQLEKKQPEEHDFKGQYGAFEGDRNNHVMKRIGGMLKNGKTWDYIENEAFKEGLACVPPLTEREIQALLRSARRYAK